MGHGGGHGGGAAEAAAGSLLGTLKGGDIVMLLVTVTVVLRVINYHYFKWPASIMMAFGSIACTVVLLVLAKVPFLHISESLSDFRLMFMDFPDLVLNYMLGFLLFAAAIEVDLRALGRIKSTIIALSFFTTFISCCIVSALTYLLLLRTAKMDFAWCLLYGAIVSPTDPVAVISILNDKPGLLPSSTRYFVLGESLLNDAVGVVLYLVFSEIVVQPDLKWADVCSLFFKGFVLECAMGILIGIVLAWIAYSAIKSVDESLLEIAITFVLVGNINMICRMWHASIPLASVAAGLVIGNYCTEFAMSETTSDTFNEMWKLLDETLNSVLFLLIGFADLFWEPGEIGWGRTVIIGISTICISLFARLVSVACPLFFIITVEWLTGKRLRHPSVRYRGGTIAVLTWGGMRGGISIALALGVPDAFVRHALPGHMTYGQLIFFMTFALVVFSICVQGMFFEPVVRLINALSLEYFPSSGLGTYESTINFNIGAGYAEEEDDIVDGDEEVLGAGGEQLPLLQTAWQGMEQDDFYSEGDEDERENGDGSGDFNLRVPPTPSIGDAYVPFKMPPKAGHAGQSSALGSQPRVAGTASILPAHGAPAEHGEQQYARRIASFANDGSGTQAQGAGHPRMRQPEELFTAYDGERERLEHDQPSIAAATAAASRHNRMSQMTAAERHKRDGSETFKNLDKLKQLPSIHEVWTASSFFGRRPRPSAVNRGAPSQLAGAPMSAAGSASAVPNSTQDGQVPPRQRGPALGGALRDVGGALRRSFTVHGSDPAGHRSHPQ